MDLSELLTYLIADLIPDPQNGYYNLEILYHRYIYTYKKNIYIHTQNIYTYTQCILLEKKERVCARRSIRVIRIEIAFV